MRFGLHLHAYVVTDNRVHFFADAGRGRCGVAVGAHHFTQLHGLVHWTPRAGRNVMGGALQGLPGGFG